MQISSADLILDLGIAVLVLPSPCLALPGDPSRNTHARALCSHPRFVEAYCVPPPTTFRPSSRGLCTCLRTSHAETAFPAVDPTASVWIRVEAKHWIVQEPRALDMRVGRAAGCPAPAVEPLYSGAVDTIDAKLVGTHLFYSFRTGLPHLTRGYQALSNDSALVDRVLHHPNVARL
ncbi:hypothetical protein FB451DRAFT_1408683 [Mycena latifolia]|nr:hypothetical protein FB451DRAFT_1408683 [Mycena latifolia]